MPQAGASLHPVTWRTIPLVTGEAEQLLRDGVALLDALDGDPTPVLRWYRSTAPALVLGRGQSERLVVDSSLPVVTRFSGGGAVLMDGGLLSLDIIVPAEHPLLEGDLIAPFGRVGAAWAAALRSLGIEGIEVHDGPATARRRGTPREQLLAAICYATLGHGEVTAGGRKVVGLAQRRRRPGALIQCGLLRRWRPQPLIAALGADAEEAAVIGAAVGLDDLLDGTASFVPDDTPVMAAVESALHGVEGAT